MIHVFYCTSRDKLSADSYQYLLNKVPAIFQKEITRFRKWEDRQHRLLGKMLLIKGMESLGLKSYSIDQLKFTSLHRPYFNDSIDFNISHSGEYVVCAISTKVKLGIDIEEIKEIPLSDFEYEFSKKEMQSIRNSQNSLRSFYELWTKKEAFLKAIGTGLSVPLNKIGIINNMVRWNKTVWYLTPLNLDEKYAAHVCANTLGCKLIIQKIELQQSYN